MKPDNKENVSTWVSRPRPDPKPDPKPQPKPDPKPDPKSTIEEEPDKTYRFLFWE